MRGYSKYIVVDGTCAPFSGPISTADEKCPTDGLDRTIDYNGRPLT